MKGFLKKVAGLNISDQAYGMLAAIGPKRFKTLKEIGRLHDEIWEMLIKWIISAPKAAKKFVLTHCAEEFDISEDGDDMLRYAFYSLYVSEVEGLILVSEGYFEKSNELTKKIFNILKNYNSAFPGYPETIEDVVDGCLNEAVEFAGYAGLFD